MTLAEAYTEISAANARAAWFEKECRQAVAENERVYAALARAREDAENAWQRYRDLGWAYDAMQARAEAAEDRLSRLL